MSAVPRPRSAATCASPVREGGAIGAALGFYLLVVACCRSGSAPTSICCRASPPGVLWMALLLAALLSLGRMFADRLRGRLARRAGTGPLPLELVAAAKASPTGSRPACRWRCSRPCSACCSIWRSEAYPLLVADMLAGTPAVSFIGAIGAALTLARPPRRAAARAAGAAALRADVDFRHRRDQRAARPRRRVVRPSSFSRQSRWRRSCWGRCAAAAALRIQMQ